MYITDAIRASDAKKLADDADGAFRNTFKDGNC